MIELIPAIDIIDGRCVRLTQGDYAQSREYGDPVEMAMRFEEAGYRRLHMVDLDGARSKHVVNCGVRRAVTKATSLLTSVAESSQTTTSTRCSTQEHSWPQPAVLP